MIAYVAHCCGSQYGICECMQSHIGVTVTEQSEPVWYLHSAEYKFAPLHKAVHVVSLSYSHRPNISLSPSISNVSENLSVWSSGDVWAVASM